MVGVSQIPWSDFQISEFPVALATGTIAFLLYWFISIAENLAVRRFDKEGLRNFNFVVFAKIVGFLAFTLACLLCAYCFPNTLGLTIYLADGNLFQSLYWIVGMGVPLVLAAWFSAANPAVRAKYPEARLEHWSVSNTLVFAAAWLFYLFGYELLFRGLWFLGMVPILGFWSAIFLNIALYSITHIPKGADEALAAIPVGFLLCLATYTTGSVWAAICIHTIMAWAGNYFAYNRVSDNA